MTCLYLVRHGETEWNAGRKIQGNIDTMLNARGIKQAELLAQRLAKENIQAVYSSSLKRAKATAALIGESTNLNVQELHDCREICLGPWEGLTIDEINEKYSDYYKIYREKPSDFNMPGAETFMQVAQRFCNAVNQIVLENEGSNIVLVSHGAAIKAAIISILGMELDYFNKFRIDNASISILNFSDRYHGGVVVNSLNDTSHLFEL